MPKIYISPERRPTPHGKYWGANVYETDYCYELAEILKQKLDFNGFETIIAPRQLDITQRSAWANANDVNFYLPLHTNASTNGTTEGKASGTQMLYGDKQACAYIHEQLTAIYATTRQVADGRDYIENNLTKMPSAYTEIAFHDNGKDVQFLLTRQHDIAIAIAKGICNYYGKPYKQEGKSGTITMAELAELLRGKGIDKIEV